MTEREALVIAIRWLENIKASGGQAVDIMINAMPVDNVGLMKLCEVANLGMAPTA